MNKYQTGWKAQSDKILAQAIGLEQLMTLPAKEAVMLADGTKYQTGSDYSEEILNTPVEDLMDDIDVGDEEHNDYVRIPTSEPLDYYCDNFDEFVEKNKLTDLDEAQEMWEEEIMRHEDHDADYKNQALSYLR